jgi:hypothetical protein
MSHVTLALLPIANSKPGDCAGGHLAARRPRAPRLRYRFGRVATGFAPFPPALMIEIQGFLQSRPEPRFSWPLRRDETAAKAGDRDADDGLVTLLCAG